MFTSTPCSRETQVNSMHLTFTLICIVPPEVLSQISCSPQLGTMRRKGSKLVIFGLLTLQVLVPRQFAHVSRSVNMEWGLKENHVAVIALHKCGKSDSQVFKLLKPLKNLRNFVYRAIQRYKELWIVEDRDWSGCLKPLRAEAAIKTVRERIRRNPIWKQKIMSRELSTPTQSSVPPQGRSTYESAPPLKGTPP